MWYNIYKLKKITSPERSAKCVGCYSRFIEKFILVNYKLNGNNHNLCCFHGLKAIHHFKKYK